LVRKVFINSWWNGETKVFDNFSEFLSLKDYFVHEEFSQLFLDATITPD
jgi:hypothetical protein